MKLKCHHCSHLNDFSAAAHIRLAFREACTQCSGDLHTCLNCSLYDPGAHHECRESSAEWVRDKERANRCEYFTPATAEKTDSVNAKQTTLTALDDLFKKE